MRHGGAFKGFALGVSLGLLGGWGLWSEASPRLDPSLVPEWASVANAEDGVLVVAVDSPATLQSVGEAVAAERIIAKSDKGFAIDSGWVVVASLESAGELLMQAGWDDEPLRIVDVGQRAREGGSAPSGVASLESLLNQPTLTRAEAYRLLDAM